MAHAALLQRLRHRAVHPGLHPHRSLRRYRSPTSTTALIAGFSRSIRSSEASSSSRAEISRARSIAASSVAGRKQRSVSHQRHTCRQGPARWRRRPPGDRWTGERRRRADTGNGTDDDGGGTFEDLGLRPELLNALAALGYEEPTPIQREAIPPLRRGPRPARPGGHRHRQDRRVRAADPAAADRRRPAPRAPSALVLVPTRELAVQVSEALHRYGRELGARVLPVYGGAADRPPAARARARGRRRRRHPGPGAGPASTAGRCGWTRSAPSCSTRPTRCSTWASPTTSRRSSTRPRSSGRPCCSPRRCRAGWTRSPAATSATRCGSASAASAPSRARRRGSGRPPTSSPARQAGRARPHPRRRGAHRRDRLLPHPRGGRLAHRDAQRPRLPRRGAARRHEPGAARPGDGPAARRDGGPAGRHRRRRPRARHRPAHPRRQLRRPVGAGGLRAPHRPGRAGPAARASRSRSPSRASTGMLKTIEQRRRARRSPSRRCRPSPTCAPGGSS